jgi:Ca2+-binding EF-hand superfamily protein
MFTLTQFINALSALLKNGNLPVTFFDFLTPCSIMDIEVLEDGVLLLFEFDRDLDGSIDGEDLLQRLQTLLKENPEIKNFPVMFNEDVNTTIMVKVTGLNISEQDECIELF